MSINHHITFSVSPGSENVQCYLCLISKPSFKDSNERELEHADFFAKPFSRFQAEELWGPMKNIFVGSPWLMPPIHQNMQQQQQQLHGQWYPVQSLAFGCWLPCYADITANCC